METFNASCRMAVQAAKTSLNDLHLRGASPHESVFIRLPHPFQLLPIRSMHLIDRLLIRRRLLHNLHRPTHNNIKRSSIRHQTDIIIEYPTTVEEWHSKPDHLLEPELERLDLRVRLKLIVEVVLAEPDDGYEISAVADGELDESLAAIEHDVHCAGLCVEGFAGAADDDGDCAAHALAVYAAFREEVVAGFARDAGEAHLEDIFAVEGDAEVGVEG